MGLTYVPLPWSPHSKTFFEDWALMVDTEAEMIIKRMIRNMIERRLKIKLITLQIYYFLLNSTILNFCFFIHHQSMLRQGLINLNFIPQQAFVNKNH